MRELMTQGVTATPILRITARGPSCAGMEPDDSTADVKPQNASAAIAQRNELALGADDHAELQRRVSAVVQANPGSRQVNQDEVELAPGALVTVPLPGETIARRPGQGVAQGGPNCPYENSCWYEHANFEGYRLTLYNCQFYNLGYMSMPDGRAWNDKISSWHNNQSGGAVADAYNWNGVNAWDFMFRVQWGAAPTLETR